MYALEVLFGNFFGLSVAYEGPPTRGFVPTVGSLRDGSTKYDTYLCVCVCVCVCVRGNRGVEKTA